MSIKTSRAKLTRLTKDLHLKWEETNVRWNDAKSREFEEKYLAELPDAVNVAANIIDEIDKVLSKVRNDCE